MSVSVPTNGRQPPRTVGIPRDRKSLLGLSRAQPSYPANVPAVATYVAVSARVADDAAFAAPIT